MTNHDRSEWSKIFSWRRYLRRKLREIFEHKADDANGEFWRKSDNELGGL